MNVAKTRIAEELVVTRNEVGESHDFEEINSDFHGVVAL